MQVARALSPEKSFSPGDVFDLADFCLSKALARPVLLLSCARSVLKRTICFLNKERVSAGVKALARNAFPPREEPERERIEFAWLEV